MARLNPDLMQVDDNGSINTVLDAVVTAILNSDAVMGTSANQSPSLEQVQNIATQLLETITPIVAPNQVVDQGYLNQLAEVVALQIVNNPTVINAGVGQPIPSTVINEIVQAVTPDPEKLDAFSNTPTPTPAPTSGAPTPTPTPSTSQTSKDEKDERTTTPAPTSGAPTPTPTPSRKTYTPAQLQAIIARLGRGETLTDEEYEAIGATRPAGAPTPTPTPTTSQTSKDEKDERTTTPAPTTSQTSKDEKDDVATTPAPSDVATTPVPSDVATTPAPTGVTTPSPTGVTTPSPTGVTTPSPTGVTTPSPTLSPTPTPTPTPTVDNSSRQSAYDILYNQFASYGLGALVEPLKGLITSDVSASEFTLRLRDSQAYKDRFRGNQLRIQNGLAAVNEASYLALEDQYQNIMRNYGLPESYYSRGYLGRQQGLEQFIANDVSATELEDRIQTAQKRLLYANPEVSIALKTFYPDITNGDLLAYTLDPTRGLEQIKRRITAAEVGSSAVQMGLATNVTDAEYLARYGVTKQSAQQGYGTIAGGLQRGSQLSSIYGQDPYTQTTAEKEVFSVPGSDEAHKQRQKITGLEKATFGGQTGITSGALTRDRAGGY